MLITTIREGGKKVAPIVITFIEHRFCFLFFFLQLSFADFMMFDFLDQLRTFEPLTLDPFQNIKDFMARIEVRGCFNSYKERTCQ